MCYTTLRLVLRDEGYPKHDLYIDQGKAQNHMLVRGHHLRAFHYAAECGSHMAFQTFIIDGIPQRETDRDGGAFVSIINAARSEDVLPSPSKSIKFSVVAPSHTSKRATVVIYPPHRFHGDNIRAHRLRLAQPLYDEVNPWEVDSIAI